MDAINLPSLPLNFKQEKIIVAEDTASYYGSGLLEVFATPAMIAFMEKTCHEGIAPYLAPGLSTVGTEVHVEHLRAVKVGIKVQCEATLNSIEGKRLMFNVRVFDHLGVIGQGTHTRYIIDIEKFMSKL
ncbi:MAG: thioesterase family protein [Lentimicrobium sp.]|jgi:predicted thioesterase